MYKIYFYDTLDTFNEIRIFFHIYILFKHSLKFKFNNILINFNLPE